MKTAVIDTGVFVAGVFWRHEPHLCLKAWLHGILVPVISEQILAEYETVLERVKQEQRFTTETGPWLDTLRTSALWVTPVALEQKVCRDPKDDKFLDAAVAGDAEYIVSGDKHLLELKEFRQISILSAREFLDWLENT